jgi:hypothetical protein
MKIPRSVQGALAGGVACALLRTGFTWYNYENAVNASNEAREALASLAFVPSVGIGFMCGAVAGSTGKVWKGAIVGGGLSAAVLVLVLLPVQYVCSLFGYGAWLAQFTAVYFVQKTVAGVLGGAFGGYIGGLGATTRGNPDSGDRPQDQTVSF